MDCYGGWIKDDGSFEEVEPYRHEANYQYDPSYAKGWIRIVENDPHDEWYSATYTPAAVTRAALITLMERYKLSGKPLYVGDWEKGGRIKVDDPDHFINKAIREKSCILSDVWRDRPCPTEHG